MRKQSFLDRETATSLLDYSGSWPPSLQEIKKISSGNNIEYIVTGSITQLGSRLSLDALAYDITGEASPQHYYAESEGMENLPFATQGIIEDILAFTGRTYRIAEISINGNTRIDSGAILRHIQNRAGDYYDLTQLREDLKSIFKMGYFNDVRISVENTDKGKKVIFTVIEKEVIGSVTITGEQEIEADDIKEVITVAPNTIINPQEIRASAENIRKLYKEKGFYDTEVTSNLTYPQDDRVNIRFDIREGKKIFIKEIYIDGNSTFSDKEIRKILSTSSKNWLSWFTEAGLLKRDILQQDASRIGAFYQNHGFIDAKVSEPQVEQSGEWLYVTFKIAEGSRYKVGFIDIQGDLIDSKILFQNMIKIGAEKYFNRQVLREDILKITEYYASHGYAFAEVNPQVSKNSEDKRVDLNINISKGDLVHINRIIIKGNTRTRDKIIRRALAVDEQSLYDAIALKRSTERLQRLDFFEDINITPEPAANEDNLMNVIVELKEKSTGTFSIGAGFSSVDGLMVMADVTQHNFLGRGQSLSLQANLGGSNTRYNINFTEPHLNDSNLSFGFDIYSWSRDYDDYDKDSTGVALRLGYPLWEKWRIYGTWGYDDSELSEVSDNASQAIKDSMDINVTHSLTLGLARDTKNRRYNPSKGSRNSFTIKKAGGILGGDSAFTKYEATTSWYFPYRWDTVFHIKGAAGYVVEDEEDRLPVYEKFYLGGLNTMRGFENGDISPVDPLTNEKIGGENMAYANLEYIFPLVKDMGLTGVVFYDTGFVHEKADDWDWQELRKSAGFGFRWLSPMGPLRLEWGMNIDPKDGEDSSLWDFSIGGQF
ncbi:MAG: outer membrane protein assembly factor BamA [Desulfobulbaceae bacterium]|nr:outer membrane protein assembly factor BamA [Desulfobulbaceae bacterium]